MDSANECFSRYARQHKTANMNGRAIPGAYLFRLYVCDMEMSWPHHIGETHQPDCVVYFHDRELRRLITKAASDLMTDVYQKVRDGHRFDLLRDGLPKCHSCNTGKSFSLWLQSGIATKLKWTDFVPWLKTSVWTTLNTFCKKENFNQLWTDFWLLL
jgi:hypothetical protein